MCTYVHMSIRDSGVRQGCTIAPVLLNIFIAYIDGGDTTYDDITGETRLFWVMYADDMAVFAESVTELQVIVDPIASKFLALD